MEVQPIGAARIAIETVPLERLREFSAHAPERYLPATPVAIPPANDVVAGFAAEIAASEIPRLIAILRPNRSSEAVAYVTDLVRDMTLALTQGDHSRALANLNAIAAVDPQTIAVLAPDEMLRPIRPEVDHLINRLTTVARMDAEGWLTQADEAVETPTRAVATDWHSRPETLLAAAHHLFDSGGYTNYVRSADLAQTIVNPSAMAYSPFLEQYSASPRPERADAPDPAEIEDSIRKKSTRSTVGETLMIVRDAAAPRIQVLWNRAPLLVLLMGWLTFGLVAGPTAILLRALWPETWPASLVDFGFEVWGTGFLALVCFGFYARIRDTPLQRPRTTNISVLRKPILPSASIVHE